MCGRYTLTKLSEREARELGVMLLDSLKARYNIAPSQVAPVVRRLDVSSGNTLSEMQWGLAGSTLHPINARGETISEKPVFRYAFQSRRCIIPATGYYEWQKRGSGKQPYYFKRQDDGLIGMAGIWNEQDGKSGFAIVTTEPNNLAKKVHDRMPVILKQDDYGEWLDINAADPESLLVPCSEEMLECFPVEKLVNNPANDSPGCIEPLKDLFG